MSKAVAALDGPGAAPARTTPVVDYLTIAVVLFNGCILAAAAYLMSIGSVVGINVIVLAGPVIPSMVFVLSPEMKLRQMVSFGAMFVVAFLGGLAVFIAAAAKGVEVPGGLANFSCTSSSMALALFDNSTLPAVVERSFFASCGSGWSEVLNYHGLRVGHKCCIQVDVRNMDCQGTGLRLVADASVNPQVLTEPSLRAAVLGCCPSLVAETTPTGYASMITTALSATVLSILVNVLRRSSFFKVVVTAPLQKLFACLSGISTGCGTCLVTLFACCLDKRALLGARGRTIRSREQLKVSSDVVNTLSTALSFTFRAAAPHVLEEFNATPRENKTTTALRPTTEFSVDGKHIIILNSSMASTACGRYTLVCGSDDRGASYELLYDMQYQEGVHAPIRIRELHPPTVLSEADPSAVQSDMRVASRIPSSEGDLAISLCSRFVAFPHNNGSFVVRSNESRTGHKDRVVPGFSCDRFMRVFYDDERVTSFVLCTRPMSQRVYLVCLMDLAKQLFVVDVDVLFSTSEEVCPPISFDGKSAWVAPYPPDAVSHLADARVTYAGYLVMFNGAERTLTVFDCLTDACGRLAKVTLPPGAATDAETEEVSEENDMLRIRGVDNDPFRTRIFFRNHSGAPAKQWITAELRGVNADGTEVSCEVTSLDADAAVHNVPCEVDEESGCHIMHLDMRFVANGSGIGMLVGTTAASACRFVYFERSTVSHVWEFPGPIADFEVCRNDEGLLLVIAFSAEKRMFYVRRVADAVDIVKPCRMASLSNSTLISMSPNGSLFLVCSEESTDVYSTNSDGVTLEDRLVSTIVGDFFSARFSKDGVMIACERHSDSLLTTTTGAGVCAIATPRDDVIATITSSSAISLKISLWKVQCDEFTHVACSGYGIEARRIGRCATCVAAYEIPLPRAPRRVFLTEDAGLLVVHARDGRLTLFDTTAVALMDHAPEEAADSSDDVEDDDDAMRRSIMFVRRIQVDGIDESARYALVRCSTSSSDITAIACLLRGECRYNPVAGATMTVLVLYMHKTTAVGHEMLVLQVKLPKDPLMQSTHEATVLKHRGILSCWDSSSSDELEDVEEDETIKAEDIAINCDGTLVALWLAKHESVLVYPVSHNVTFDAARIRENDPNVEPLEPLPLEPSPLLEEHYEDLWKETALGHLLFHNTEPTTLLRFSRPANHWTYHVEQWDLAPKPKDFGVVHESEDVAVELFENGAVGVEKMKEATALGEMEPPSTDYVIVEPVRTDRVGYMSGDPTVSALQISTSCNHMVHLSTNGVSLYRRPPTGDDNDDAANAFFWWSSFVAELYAPSEYLLIPLACLLYGYISSIVVAALNGEGFAGFAARVANGAALQNWVDIISVFISRALIVKSGFLPVCGDAELTVVESNNPVHRLSRRTMVLRQLVFAQGFVVIMYPIILPYLFQAVFILFIPLLAIIFVVAAFGVMAAWLILVRRSFDRTRWIGHDRGDAVLSDRVQTRGKFYSAVLRLFLFAFVLMTSINFSLQLFYRTSINAGLMRSGTGDFAKFYDTCLQYSGDCRLCNANSCMYCKESKTCVSFGRDDMPCGTSDTSSSCYASSNTTCAAYSGDGLGCVGWHNCGYCTADGTCNHTSLTSTCSVPVVTVANHSFVRNTTDWHWWEALPYLGSSSSYMAQLLFYQLQISSGTCSAVRVTESTWSNANYITSLP